MERGISKTLKNIGVAVVCLCILSYSIFHFSSLFAEEIGTIVVGPTSESSVASINGYVFRDAEIVYRNNYGGAVEYLVENGEKVSAKTDLARVYSEGGTQLTSEMLLVIDEQIALLKSTTDERLSVSQVTNLRRRASDAYYSIMKQLASGKSLSLGTSQKKLLVSLNSIATITDENFKIKETLNELLNIRAELLGAGGDSELVSTEKSGYFYTVVDGYEEAFSGIAAQKLTREELAELINEPNVNSDDDISIGKMSYDANWYFVSVIDKKTADNFIEGNRYTVEFTSGGRFDIDMTVSRLLVDENGDETVIVFESDELPKDFNFRRQTANITLSRVSGIYVPKAAVKRENFEKVVYILKGSVVQLRHIDIIYEGSDYYIVSEEPRQEDKEKNYLKSNEQLIVRGSNLFDGRILG